MSKEAIFQGVRMQTRKAITRTISRTAVNESETADLARRIAAYAPHDGTFDLSVPGLHVSRFSRINASCAHAIQLPALCLIVRGAKTVIVGQEVYEYDASRMLVFSVALPVAAQVTQASFSEPYLALRLGEACLRDLSSNWEGNGEHEHTRSGVMIHLLRDEDALRPL